MTMVSVMTLVDSDKNLSQTYKSLVAQSHKDWEWLLVPLATVDIPTKLTDDKRVRLLSPSGFVASQGETGCKTFAVEQALSSHVLELDQHDHLHLQAIENISAAINSADPDLLYSDFVNVPVEGGPVGYGAEYGWQTYDIRTGNRSEQVIKPFDAEPSALHQASYAPSHGLTWRRTAYLSLDGPDPSLGSTAGFDLVCRAYLAGLSFHHVPRCIVFSRQLAYRRRDPIVETRVSQGHEYALVAEWARREGLPMLDLGAAHNPAPGFTSVDLHDAQINCDLRSGLPLEDGSVACIRAYDFLEHMNHCPDSTCLHGADGRPRCVVGVMNELYRVLAPGGWIISQTPSSDGRGAFQDPTHSSYWNPNSFWYYTRRDQSRFVPGIECRFQSVGLHQSYPTPWHEANNILYVHADLVALKGQRQPGICEI